MTTPAKLTGFAATLAVLVGGGIALGGAIDPDRSGGESPASHGGQSSEMAEMSPVRGVAVAENGLRLVVADPELARGRTEQLAFRIVDEDGETVEDFDVAHTKRMHMIVARRDMSGFQHLHPEQAGDGSWTLPVRIADAGSYRLFADFERDGEKTTLATDLRVDGPADLQPLPAPATTATSDGGYQVALETEAGEPGEETHLDFTVTKDGREVQTEPYLGAGGHLVALREGDMAFLHVHPTEEEGEDGVSFGATFPTQGRYRLFLQFKIDETIQTVAFTQEVKQS
jgi:hypothetical protein